MRCNTENPLYPSLLRMGMQQSGLIPLHFHRRHCVSNVLDLLIKFGVVQNQRTLPMVTADDLAGEELNDILVPGFRYSEMQLVVKESTVSTER